MALPVAAAAAALAVAPLYHPPDPAPRGPVVASEANEGLYHPIVSVIRSKLASPTLTADQRKAVLVWRLNWLKARRNAAEKALLDNGFSADFPAKMVKATASGPLVRRSQLQARLDLKQDLPLAANDPERIDSDSKRAYTNTADAFSRLSSNDVSDGANDATGDKAAHLLLQIRCLADVYARWEVAARVSQILQPTQFCSPELTGVEMLARALAFWRTEGDLSVPPENDTLDGSDTPDDGTTPKIPLPPGRTRFKYLLADSVRGQMAAMTFLVRRPAPPEGGWLNVWTGLLETADMADAATSVRYGDIATTVAQCGLDILWLKSFQVRAEQLLTTDPPFAPADDLSWPALNRKAPPDAHVAAQTDRDRRRALLVGVSIGPPAVPSTRVACAPSAGYVASDPGFSGAAAEYSALALKEALSYLNRLTLGTVRFGPAASTRVPEMIVYLLYHTGDKAKGMLASAAGHAVLKASKSAAAASLKAALPAAASDSSTEIGGFLKTIRNTASDDSIKAAKDHWDKLGPVLGTDAVLKALNDYIKTEDLTVWKSWQMPRANVIDYDNLYQHHLKLFKAP